MNWLKDKKCIRLFFCCANINRNKKKKNSYFSNHSELLSRNRATLFISRISSILLKSSKFDEPVEPHDSIITMSIHSRKMVKRIMKWFILPQSRFVNFLEVSMEIELFKLWTHIIREFQPGK